MIRLARPRRRAVDSVVPMINVAFLLLIFFMMVAVIAPQNSRGIDPPSGRGERASPDIVMTVDRAGRVMRDGVSDGDTFAGLDGRAVTIRADAALDAARFARLVARLRAQGVSDISLAVSGRADIR